MREILDYYFEHFFVTTCMVIGIVVTFSYFFGLVFEFFEGKISTFFKGFIAVEYKLIPYVITIFLSIAVIFYHGIVNLVYLIPLYLFVIYKYIRTHK